MDLIQISTVENAILNNLLTGNISKFINVVKHIGTNDYTGANLFGDGRIDQLLTDSLNKFDAGVPYTEAFNDLTEYIKTASTITPTVNAQISTLNDKVDQLAKLINYSVDGSSKEFQDGKELAKSEPGKSKDELDIACSKKGLDGQDAVNFKFGYNSVDKKAPNIGSGESKIDQTNLNYSNSLNKVMIAINDSQYLSDNSGHITDNISEAYITDIKDAKLLIKAFKNEFPNIRIMEVSDTNNHSEFSSFKDLKQKYASIWSKIMAIGSMLDSIDTSSSDEARAKSEEEALEKLKLLISDPKDWSAIAYNVLGLSVSPSEYNVFSENFADTIPRSEKERLGFKELHEIAHKYGIGPLTYDKSGSDASFTDKNGNQIVVKSKGLVYIKLRNGELDKINTQYAGYIAAPLYYDEIKYPDNNKSEDVIFFPFKIVVYTNYGFDSIGCATKSECELKFKEWRRTHPSTKINELYFEHRDKNGKWIPELIPEVNYSENFAKSQLVLTIADKDGSPVWFKWDTFGPTVSSHKEELMETARKIKEKYPDIRYNISTEDGAILVGKEFSAGNDTRQLSSPRVGQFIKKRGKLLKVVKKEGPNTICVDKDGNRKVIYASDNAFYETTDEKFSEVMNMSNDDKVKDAVKGKVTGTYKWSKDGSTLAVIGVSEDEFNTWKGLVKDVLGDEVTVIGVKDAKDLPSNIQFCDESTNIEYSEDPNKYYSNKSDFASTPSKQTKDKIDKAKIIAEAALSKMNQDTNIKYSSPAGYDGYLFVDSKGNMTGVSFPDRMVTLFINKGGNDMKDITFEDIGFSSDFASTPSSAAAKLNKTVSGMNDLSNAVNNMIKSGVKGDIHLENKQPDGSIIICDCKNGKCNYTKKTPDGKVVDLNMSEFSESTMDPVEKLKSLKAEMGTASDARKTEIRDEISVLIDQLPSKINQSEFSEDVTKDTNPTDKKDMKDTFEGKTTGGNEMFNNFDYVMNMSDDTEYHSNGNIVAKVYKSDNSWKVKGYSHVWIRGEGNGATKADAIRDFTDQFGPLPPKVDKSKYDQDFKAMKAKWPDINFSYSEGMNMFNIQEFAEAVLDAANKLDTKNPDKITEYLKENTKFCDQNYSQLVQLYSEKIVDTEEVDETVNSSTDDLFERRKNGKSTADFDDDTTTPEAKENDKKVDEKKSTEAVNHSFSVSGDSDRYENLKNYFRNDF